MVFWKTIDVADNERALLFRRNCFEAILEPGRHRICQIMNNIRIELFDITDVVFNHTKAKFLLHTHHKKLKEYLEYYEMSDTQVGLFYRDDHLVDILAPGTFRAVWKGVDKLRMEVIDISENYVIDNKRLRILNQGLKAGYNKSNGQAFSYVELADEHVGLLIVDGKFQKLLEPGAHGYWRFNRSIVVKSLDMRLQMVEVGGQDILTKDRVSLRINLSASYKIIDPEVVALKVGDFTNFVYRELQLKLREVVGTRLLDNLLADKNSLNTEMAKDIHVKLAEYGVEIISVGVKDIILPGEMKSILNQVVEAQKESEANLIRRREETQAMRSLHNTAKMMENNPTLIRLKELEALERITERIDKISVYGGLDSVLNDMVNLKAVQN